MEAPALIAKGESKLETARGAATTHLTSRLTICIAAWVRMCRTSAEVLPRASGSCGANIQMLKSKCPEILRSNLNRANEVILRRRGLISEIYKSAEAFKLKVLNAMTTKSKGVAVRRKKVLRMSDVLALGRGLHSYTSHQRNATPGTIASGNSRE